MSGGAAESPARAVDASVVIPTIGRPDSLRACLESLAQCSPRAAEVVVVDQSMERATADVVSEFATIGARIVTSEPPGVGRARNAGLRSARSTTVLMTDDDCTVDPRWVGIGAALVAEDRGRIATGRVLAPEGAGQAVPSVKDEVEPHEYTGELACAVLYSGNMALDRDAISGAGGFDEHLETAEDNDLCYRWLRAGRRLVFDPELVVWHNDWRSAAELRRVYLGYWRGQGTFYGKHLRRGDLRMLRFIARDLRGWGLGLAVDAARKVRGKPRARDEWHGILRGLATGLVRGWRTRARGRAEPMAIAADRENPAGPAWR
jgi:GT2 family glycosyltransferase